MDSSQKVSSACLNHFPGLSPWASRAQCLPSETWLCLRPDGPVQHLRESAVAPGACSTLALPSPSPSTSSFTPPSYLSCKLNILHLFFLFIRLSSLAASHFEPPPPCPLPRHSAQPYFSFPSLFGLLSRTSDTLGRRCSTSPPPPPPPPPPPRSLRFSGDISYSSFCKGESDDVSRRRGPEQGRSPRLRLPFSLLPPDRLQVFFHEERLPLKVQLSEESVRKGRRDAREDQPWLASRNR